MLRDFRVLESHVSCFVAINIKPPQEELRCAHCGKTYVSQRRFDAHIPKCLEKGIHCKTFLSVSDLCICVDVCGVCVCVTVDASVVCV